MMESKNTVPDTTAIRVALWRALHVKADPPPHVLHDEIGLKLAGVDESWRERPDMNPVWSAGSRASIVARARFIEDLVKKEADNGISQYVILGAGLDTFAQREPEVGKKIKIFEIDKSDTQFWKKQQLQKLGFEIPAWLKFVPVDFENGPTWLEQLSLAGFDQTKPAVIASTGVSMYLTKEANEVSLCQIATLAAGSTLAMTFILPLELLDESERELFRGVYERARAAGNPFLSFFTPEEMKQLALHSGFKTTDCFTTMDLTDKYFSGRSDGLKPSSGEAFLVAKT